MLIAAPEQVLALLLVAVLVDALVGDPPALWRLLPHPVVLIGRGITALERLLLDPGALPASQFRRGMLACAVVVAGAAAAGLAVQRLAAPLAGGWAVEGVVASTLLAQRGLYLHVAAVADGLERGLAEGRAAVARIVGRDPQSLDAHAVARAAIESAAENLGDGVVAPLFWGLLLGLPGMAAYKAINTLDSMIGHKTPRYRHFGRFAARLDDAASLVPARLAALLLVLAALLFPGARPAGALRAMARDARRHRSPNAGWPEAAMAGALGLRLGGPRRYGGDPVADAWMGDGRAEAGPGDIRRALVLLVLACLAAALCLLGLLLARLP